MRVPLESLVERAGIDVEHLDETIGRRGSQVESVGREFDPEDRVAMGRRDRTGQWPSAVFHSFSSPEREGSPPPVANSLPSGLNAKASTRSTNMPGSSTLPIVRSKFQAGVAFQRMPSLSPPSDRTSPAGAKATAVTGA